jgi:hypothetical protein
MDITLPPRCVRLAELVLPELRGLPAGERARALRRASTSPFDVVELLALAVAGLGASASVASAAVVASLVVIRWMRRNLVANTAGPGA